jgi:hypothetical protein
LLEIENFGGNEKPRNGNVVAGCWVVHTRGVIVWELVDEI